MKNDSKSCQYRPSNIILSVKFIQNEQKKRTLKIQKSKLAILVINQSSISAVFQIVRFPGDQKTALTGESLYNLTNNLIFLPLRTSKIREIEAVLDQAIV